MQLKFEKVAPLGRIGQILLATDFNSESDIRRMLPEGVDLFTNRVMNYNPLTLENLLLLQKDLTRAASGILPEFGVDAMIFGCTSGTIAIGEETVRDLIHAACPGVPVTTPLTAALAALGHLTAKRISILTPYTGEINRQFEAYFESRGIEVVSLFGLNMEDDIAITKVLHQVIQEAAISSCSPDAEALFISCTALRASAVIQAIEDKLGIPVIASNQALAWHVMQLLNIPAKIPGYGRLLHSRCSTLNV